jgi:hypothetical protein
MPIAAAVTPILLTLRMETLCCSLDETSREAPPYGES